MANKGMISGMIRPKTKLIFMKYSITQQNVNGRIIDEPMQVANEVNDLLLM